MKLSKLVIKVIDNPTDRRPPLDQLIAPTIAAIINDFLLEKTALPFSSAIRPIANTEPAGKKFNRGYNYFAATDYMRIDDAFRDANEELLYHCALIAKRKSPYLRELG